MYTCLFWLIDVSGGTNVKIVVIRARSSLNQFFSAIGVYSFNVITAKAGTWAVRFADIVKDIFPTCCSEN